MGMNAELKTIEPQTDNYPELASFVNGLDVRPVTAQGYAKKVRRFMQWLKATGITAPDAGSVRAFRQHLIAEGMSSYSVSAYLSAVRCFYRWAEVNGLVPNNIAQSVKGTAVRRAHAKDALTAEQVKRVLACARDARESALLALLFTTGIRSIEAVRANVGDLRQNGDWTVLYVWGKGHDSADDFVVVPDKVVRLIHAYFNTRRFLKESDPLFAGIGNRNAGGRMDTRSIRRIVKRVFQLAEVASPTITTHSTRHTAVTLALTSGATVQEAQALARHANITTTQVYAHNLEKLQAGTTDLIGEKIL